MNVKAFGLVTGHPVAPRSLPTHLRDAVRADHAGKPRLYASHLEPEALDEVWAAFDSALRPLHDAGKLGAVVGLRTHNGLFAPPFLVLVMIISNDRRTMGNHCNGRTARTLGWGRPSTSAGRHDRCGARLHGLRAGAPTFLAAEARFQR